MVVWESTSTTSKDVVKVGLEIQPFLKISDFMLKNKNFFGEKDYEGKIHSFCLKNEGKKLFGNDTKRMNYNVFQFAV